MGCSNLLFDTVLNQLLLFLILSFRAVRDRDQFEEHFSTPPHKTEEGLIKKPGLLRVFLVWILMSARMTTDVAVLIVKKVREKEVI